MSFISSYIEKDIENNPDASEEYQQLSLNMDAAVIVREMRDDLGMSQKEFAKYVHKPQSTITRIESGTMNVNMQLLNEIATAAHRRLKLTLVN